MRIYFLRHGESEANVAGVISDDPANIYHLTPMGIAQAKDKAEKETKSQKAKIRKEGAEGEVPTEPELPSAPALDTYPISTDHRLNERHSGMDGQPVAAFNSLVKPDPVHIKPEGGESFLEQMERLRAFMDAVADRHVDATILAVSHENPILAAQAVAGRSPEEAAKSDLANGAWVALEWPAAD